MSDAEPAALPHPATLAAFEELRTLALRYPESHEDHPWGETAIKVRKKVFVFLSKGSERGLGVTVKLPHSHMAALTLTNAEPTHYGMGKYGWVTARFPAEDDVPVQLIREWIEESFRAIAPKRLGKTVPEGGPA